MAGGLAWWRFLPPEAGKGARPPLRFEGRGTLSRSLRAARAGAGSLRAASLLRARAAEAEAVLVPVRLLLVAPVQPRSLVDALTLAFAVAGLAVAIEAIDGYPALGLRLDDDVAGLDLALLVEPPDGAGAAGIVRPLAERIVSRWRVPVAIAGFDAAGPAEAPVAPGLDRLAIAVEPAEAFDRRFAESFGAILTSHAADRLADGAAAWAARRRGLAAKVVLTDLDGTLWRGILGERAPGEAPPAVHTAYAEALMTLSGRGLVLGVASRNAPADVADAFAAGVAAPLSADAISVFAAGWEEKAELVAEALGTLGLAPGHAVFIDDDPVNCAGVAARFPEMDVRLAGADPEAFARDLLADPGLLGGGAEASERAARYRAKAGVDRLRAEAPDKAAFLAALATRLTLVPLGPRNLGRAAELAQRVNQFRLSDLRPGVAELGARSSAFDRMVRLDDVFGAHGLVGLILARLEGETLVVDDLLLSCRALERRVEDAMLGALGLAAAKQGALRIVGRLRALPRNEPARRWIEGAAGIEAEGRWTIVPAPAGAAPDASLPDVVWAAGEEGEGA